MECIQESECTVCVFPNSACPKIVELFGALQSQTWSVCCSLWLQETDSGLKLKYGPGSAEFTRASQPVAAATKRDWASKPASPVAPHHHLQHSQGRSEGMALKVTKSFSREPDFSSGRYCISWASLPHIHPFDFLSFWNVICVRVSPADGWSWVLLVFNSFDTMTPCTTKPLERGK